MAEADRLVRSTVLELLIAGRAGPTPAEVAAETGLDLVDVGDSFRRLAEQHRLVLTAAGDRVLMAHPFSGVPTGYQSRSGERQWWGNCGWDAFAILALLGDGEVVASSTTGDEARWHVERDVVTPEGIVHFVVPPRRFWDDIGFT